MTKSKESKSTDLQPASQPSYLQLTEDGIKQALIEARGDIFVASQLLRVTAIRLQRAIQVSAVLQAVLDEIPKLSKGLSLEALHSAVEQRVALYRVAGLDALHDLATMPLDDNSAQNQVKLAAAARLAGSVEVGGGSGIEDTLRELNAAYQKEAPRLRIVREKVTIEAIPAERVIEPEGAAE